MRTTCVSYSYRETNPASQARPDEPGSLLGGAFIVLLVTLRFGVASHADPRHHRYVTTAAGLIWAGASCEGAAATLFLAYFFPHKTFFFRMVLSVMRAPWIAIIIGLLACFWGAAQIIEGLSTR